MSTTTYQFSETAEDMHALAAEMEEQQLAQEQAMIAQAAIDYNKGWNDAYCSRPSCKGTLPTYLEGYDDGRYMWKRDCSR